jgi:hypothetical protein
VHRRIREIFFFPKKLKKLFFPIFFQIVSKMTIGYLECLPTVFEFLPLMEVSALGHVNQYWNYVSSVCPMSVIDTVGLSIPIPRLMALINANRQSLVSLRMSNEDLECLIDEILTILPYLVKLESIAVFQANDDGSVSLGSLWEVDKYTAPRLTGKGVASLVLGCDPAIPAVGRLLNRLTPNLTTLAFLRGTENFFKTETDIQTFLSSNCSLDELQCLYLGHCLGTVDMDPVIALLLNSAKKLRYVEWSNAGAGLDMMKAIMKTGSIHCAFEGAGFLSFLFRMA